MNGCGGFPALAHGQDNGSGPEDDVTAGPNPGQGSQTVVIDYEVALFVHHEFRGGLAEERI